MKMNFNQLIPEYPIGSDLLLLNATYHRGSYNGEKWSKDSMTLLYKDNQTGEKHFHIIKEPLFSFYMTKEGEEPPTYRKFFESEKNLQQVMCKYKGLYLTIATKLGPKALKFYNDNKKANYKELNKLNADVRLFGSDININDFYRMRFAEQYQNRQSEIRRAYLDIEVDNLDYHGKGIVDETCPVNAVSYVDHDTKQVTTFLLDQTSKNESMVEFINSYTPDGFQKEFMDLLNKTLKDKVAKYKLENLQTKLIIYKDERCMLVDLFRFINTEKPDFLLAWNMVFDIPFLMNRMKYLGLDSKEVICSPDFPPDYRKCTYFIDDFHKDYAEKNEYADISSYTIYLDQMIQFASRRKGQSKYRSYSLDSIGEVVAGIHKLNYEDIASHISELPYTNYKIFVMYNIMDVLVQYCIEFVSDDIPFVFNKALVNSTRYDKVHRQTIYLANRATTRFRSDEYGNLILGNNLNKIEKKPKVKYEGAFVADPNLLDDSIKNTINGTPIMRISDSIDFDFTRLYPSIAQENNLAPNTLIGYIDIPSKVYDNENSINNDKYTRSGQFIEDFISESPIEFLHRWFHLANFKEMYNDVLDYFNTVESPTFPIDDIIYHTKRENTIKENPCPVSIKLLDMDKKVEPLSQDKKNELKIKFKRSTL